MPSPTDLLGRLVPSGQHVSPAFGALLLLHVLAGLICVVAGAVAAASPKRPERHPRFGTVYYWALSVVLVTAAGMSVLRWPQDAYLLALGTTAFGLASVGFSARKIRWRGWRSVHIVGMSLSSWPGASATFWPSCSARRAATLRSTSTRTDSGGVDRREEASQGSLLLLRRPRAGRHFGDQLSMAWGQLCSIPRAACRSRLYSVSR
jgi:hypothetical protein